VLTVCDCLQVCWWVTRQTLRGGVLSVSRQRGSLQKPTHSNTLSVLLWVSYVALYSQLLYLYFILDIIVINRLTLLLATGMVCILQPVFIYMVNVFFKW